MNPLPGASPDGLCRALANAANEAFNVRGAGGTWDQALAKYLVWASDTAANLAGHLRPSDVDRLITTPGHARLLACAGWPGAGPGWSNIVFGLLRLELDARVRELAATRDAVQGTVAQWAGSQAIAVLDTGFYINVQKPYESEGFDLRQIDFAAILGVRSEIRLMVPIAVLDELDGLKQRGNPHARWRAGHTLGVLDEVLRHGKATVGLLRRSELGQLLSGGVSGVPRLDVLIEVVLDPVGHVRLPITDDEIIDRALAIKTMAGRDVFFVTYDNGSAMRASQAGLEVVKLSTPTGDEPEGSKAKPPTTGR